MDLTKLGPIDASWEVQRCLDLTHKNRTSVVKLLDMASTHPPPPSTHTYRYAPHPLSLG